MKNNLVTVEIDPKNLHCIQAAIERIAKGLVHPNVPGEPVVRLSEFDITYNIGVMEGLLHLREQISFSLLTIAKK